MIDWWADILFEKILYPGLVILLTIVLICIPFIFWGFMRESKKPTFELKKDEWSCSRKYEYTTTSMIMVGKVLVPQTATHHDCIQWSKN